MNGFIDSASGDGYRPGARPGPLRDSCTARAAAFPRSPAFGWPMWTWPRAPRASRARVEGTGRVPVGSRPESPRRLASVPDRARRARARRRLFLNAQGGRLTDPRYSLAPGSPGGRRSAWANECRPTPSGTPSRPTWLAVGRTSASCRHSWAMRTFRPRRSIRTWTWNGFARCTSGRIPMRQRTEDRMKIRSTTIMAVRRDGKVAMAGDGQVTMGETVMKSNARKVRKIYDGKVLAGFAGATADAFTLLEHFEVKIKEYSGRPDAGPPWSWPRIGARTRCSAGWRPCCWSRTRRRRCCCPEPETSSSPRRTSSR